MNNIYFGSLVEAGLHAQRLQSDKNLARVNKKIPLLFKDNRIEVKKKFSLNEFLKEFHL